MLSLARFLVAIILISIGTTHPTSAARSEIYQSAYVDGAAPLAFEADPRTYVGGETTIELVVSMMPLSLETDQPIPVLSLGGRGGLTLWVSPDRQQVGVSSHGAEPGELNIPLDFTDDEFHRIVLTIHVGAVDLQVDDGEVLNAGFIAPEAPTPDGLTVIFGGNGSTSLFQGWVRTFRLWHDVIQDEALESLKDERGWPSESDRYDRDRIAIYSHFTDQRKALVQTRPNVTFTGIETGMPGDYLYVPFGHQDKEDEDGLIGMFASPWQTSPDMLQFFFIDVPRSADSQLFYTLPLNPDGTPLELARYGAELRLQMAEDDGVIEPGGREHRRFMKMMFAGIGDPEGEDVTRTAQAWFNADWKLAFTPLLNFDFGAIAGTHDGERVASLSFKNARGDEVASFGKSESWHQPFYLRIPSEKSLAGIVLKQGDAGLVGLGLGLADKTQDRALSQLGALIGRRLIAETAPVPSRLNPNVEAADHGTFSNQTVYVLRRIPGADGVALLADNGTPAIQVQYFEYKSGSVYQRAANWPDSLARWTDQEIEIKRTREFPEKVKLPLSVAPHLYDQMAILNGRVHLIDHGKSGNQLVLQEPRAYGPNSRDKLPWGATFSLEQRATRTRANFVGYDVSKMDPRDYQSSIGRRDTIFDYPKEDSRDYQTSDSKLIYPNGLFLNSDAKGSERSVTKVVHSSDELTEFWSNQIGNNVAIPNFASFSNNEKYAGESSTLFKWSSKLALATTRANHYGLVLDQGRAALSSEFASAAFELRDRLQLGLLPNESEARLKVLSEYRGQAYQAGSKLLPADVIANDPDFWSSSAVLFAEVNQLDDALNLEETTFFQRFGTHYPYAVTYGGLLHLTISERAFDRQDTIKSNQEFERGAELTLARLSFGRKEAEGAGFSHLTGEGLSNQSASYGSVGGSLSANGGWSLGRGEEVPILLDLRPLSHLFSPIYFDDIAIWTELRYRMFIVMRLYTEEKQRKKIRLTAENINYDRRRRNTLESKAQLICGLRATPEQCAAQGWRSR